MTARVPEVAFVFVCQAGPLEAQACLLAASLRNLDRSNELIAFVPGPVESTGRVLDKTLDVLQSLAVRIEYCDNPQLMLRRKHRTADYMTNKFCCLEVETSAQTLVFLDSDQICTAPLEPLLLDTPLTAPLVGHAGAQAVEGCWHQLYECCGVQMPLARFPVTSYGKSQTYFIPPSFNTGLVSVRTGQAKKLASTWRDCFNRVDGTAVNIGDDNYYLEQACLAVAAEKMQIEYHIAAPELFEAAILHYHRPEHLHGRTEVLAQIRDLLGTTKELNNVLARFKSWSELLGFKLAGTSDRTEEGDIDSDRVAEERLLDAETVIGDTTAYPVCISRDWKRLRIISLPRQNFNQYAFHDVRELRTCEIMGELPVTEVADKLKKAGRQDRPVDVICHTAFCGSTLLARYLQLPGKVVYYREPQLFTQLSVQKWYGYPPGFEPWRGAFDVGLRLLSRSVPDDVRLGMKLHDSGTNLIDEILNWHSQSRALILHSDLSDFLVSVLKHRERRDWIRTRLPSCGGSSYPGLAHVDIRELNDAEACAYLWLSQIETCRAAIGRNMGRVRSIRSADLFASPSAVVRHVCRFFQYDVTDEMIADVVEIESGQHAKTFQQTDVTLIQQEHDRLRTQFQKEIAEGMAWAVEHRGDDALVAELPNRIVN